MRAPKRLQCTGERLLFLFDELRGLDWSPQADIYRTPTGWVVVLDLAGVSPDEVMVEAVRSELRVAGVRRDRFVRKGFLQHSMEISYSRFERTLRLPCTAEDCRIRTEYVDGMLVITLDTLEREEET
jgi:HSP20 family protein